MENAGSQSAVVELTARVDLIERNLSDRVDAIERRVQLMSPLPKAAAPNGAPAHAQPPPPGFVPPPGAPAGQMAAAWQSPSMPPPGTLPSSSTPPHMLAPPSNAGARPRGPGHHPGMPVPPGTPRPGSDGNDPRSHPFNQKPAQPRFEFSVEALLRWSGLVLVALAAVFLVSTAINRGWIGPELQLLGAALIGCGLLAGSLRLATSNRPWALALAHGGSAVIVVCAGASHQWLGLVNASVGIVAVGVAAVASIMVAIRLDRESVAVTTVLTALALPGWMELAIDAPIGVSASWLVVVALLSTAVGLYQRWTLFRLVATWLVAAWLMGIAGYLYETDEAFFAQPLNVMVGAGSVVLIMATLWLAPLLKLRFDDAQVHPLAQALTAIEHRLTILIPLMSWGAIVWMAAIDSGHRAGPLGLIVASGFVVLAGGVWQGKPLPKSLIISHLFGAGLLASVSLVLWLGGPVLVVAVAVQALGTLVLAYHFKDLLLKVNAATLAGLAALLLSVSLVDAGQADQIMLGSLVAHAAVLAIGASMAWLIGQNETKQWAEGANALAWLMLLGFATSLITPYSQGSGPTILLTTFALASLAASRQLGLGVLITGIVLGASAVLSGAVGIIDATLNGADAYDHVSNLVSVVGLGTVAALAWIHERDRFGHPLFLMTWVGAMGWLASILIDGPQGQASISVVWALAACGAIVAGIRFNAWSVRLSGLITLGVVLVKLMTVDLAEVDTLWRVGLFLIVGLALLRLGYVLPKLVDRYSQAPLTDPPEAAKPANGW